LALNCLYSWKKSQTFDHLLLPLTKPVDIGTICRLEGFYQNEVKPTEIIEFERYYNKLYIWYDDARLELRSLDESTLIEDDKLHFNQTKVVLLKDTPDIVVVNGTRFKKIKDYQSSAIPQQWEQLIGEYGWDYNTLFIFERYQRLYCLFEWTFYSPLEELKHHEFKLAPGLYTDENVSFKQDDKGTVYAAVFAGIQFKKRHFNDVKDTFKIEKREAIPFKELRDTALKATPPKQEPSGVKVDLVELHSLEPSLKYDIRYATTNNFMDEAFYEESLAFLQRPAAEGLVRAHRFLKEKFNFGILVYDAYRPWHVTKMFWDATPDHQRHFVADPSQGSRHNRGCAIDLTLYDIKTGEPLDMGSGYDEMTARAYSKYPGGTSLHRWRRRILRDALEAEGFTVYIWEWWHYDYKDFLKYPVLNLQLKELAPNKQTSNN